MGGAVCSVFEDPNWLLNLVYELTCTNTWFLPYARSPVNTPVRPFFTNQSIQTKAVLSP